MTASGDASGVRCSACGTLHTSGAGCPAGAGLHVGTVLDGKYELVRLIGSGGMGEVYEGRHRVIGRRVAVKFLHGEYARRPEVATRFANEARAAGGIEHENIAGVYDVGSLPDATQFLVMEFLDGMDLERLHATEGPLPVARVVFALIQACRGLDVVHGRGIVHRDLKPANLFVTKRADKTDLVKVIDFGIAKLSEIGGGTGTKTGTTVGTAYYMSPEQARGERDVGAATDIYAIGVILYELLSGKRPHEGESFLEILHKLMLQKVVPLQSVRPGLPDGLYEVVARAMESDAADRFTSMAELGDALLPYAGRSLSPIRSNPDEGRGATADRRSGVARGVSAGDFRATTTGGQASQRGDELVVPKSRLWLAVGGITAVVAIAGVAMAVLQHEGAPTPSAAASPVAQPVPPTKPDTIARVAPPPEETVAPPASTARTLDSLPRADSRPTAAANEKRPSVQATRTVAPVVAPQPTAAAIAQTPPVKPVANCDPPFTIDETGHHHYKPECVQ